jgi:chitodextrinase
LFTILLLAIFSLGCAVPGEPLPPLLEIPAPVTDLTAQQVGDTLRVTIPVPRLTTEGTLPKHLERIELFVTYAPPAAAQPEFAAPAEQVWNAGDLRDGSAVLSHEIRLSSRLIGQRAWLAVRASNHRGSDAGLSNVVAVDIAALPAPPQAVSATVTEKAIELRWTASTQSVFGGGVPAAANAEYEVFRAAADTESLTSIGRTSSTSFRDEEISLGSNYRYAVRAVVPSEVSLAATTLSDTATVAAADRFAPAPPADLRAIAVTGAVELAWSPNAEADLAGYNVYREQLGEDGRASAPRVKLNAAPLDIPLFRDTNIRPAMRYAYTATAVDRDGNESAPSNEETVETE